VAAERLPVCGFRFVPNVNGTPGRAMVCKARGGHVCGNRARHVIAFFCEVLTHTKGDWAGKPFIPAPWQRDTILVPLFARVIWDEMRKRYVRRYRTLYLCMARKNGKTEMLAGLVLYLLVADHEQGAEIYGMARDAGQAGLVYRVARQMVKNSAALNTRLETYPGMARIVDEETGSFYQVMSGEWEGNLGENPSGAYIDELLTQPDRDLYDAVRTGMGARAQPLLMMATTAENDPAGFAASERAWSERVADDPWMDPDRLSVIYQADPEDDWTNPVTWKQANPALGDFLEYRALESECRGAQNNPAEERAFRQYRLNQPSSAVGRAIALAAWDACTGEDDTPALLAEELEGRQCFGGLDLATTQDLAALALVFPLDDGSQAVLWRHFVPAHRLQDLARRTGGMANVWVARGELTVTDSPVTDYEVIHAVLDELREHYDIREVAYDPWNAVQLAVELSDEGWTMIQMAQSARAMAASTSELLRLIAAGQLRHGRSGIMRWQAGNAVTRINSVGNIRLDKAKSAEKIDGLVAAVMGLDRALRRSEKAQDYLATGW
jgi:phage terminase large subunit-like protein